MLTCNDDAIYDASEYARWRTFGDLRKSPPPGGNKAYFHAIYKHWILSDDTVTIDPAHPIFQTSDEVRPAFWGTSDMVCGPGWRSRVPVVCDVRQAIQIGQLFETRLTQTVKPLYVQPLARDPSRHLSSIALPPPWQVRKGNVYSHWDPA